MQLLCARAPGSYHNWSRYNTSVRRRSDARLGNQLAPRRQWPQLCARAHVRSVTPQEEIEAGVRVANFLADEAVEAAFVRLEAGYWTGFKTSQDVKAQEAFGAKARVLEDLKNELQGIVNNGIVATRTRERANRR